MKGTLLLAAWCVLAPAAFGHPRLPVTPPPSAERQLADQIRRLGAATEDERLQGVRGIKELGPAGLPAVAVLVRTFRDSSPRVQAAIAEVLGTYGPAAKEALPVLIDAIRQPQASSNVISETSRAIAALGEPRNPVMIRTCLAHQNLGRRRFVPLTELMTRYPTMLPAVADFLADPVVSVRSRAAQYVHRFLKQAEAEKQTRLSALTADDRRQVVARLQGAVGDREARVRSWAIGSLIEIEPSSAPAAMPAVVTLIRARNDFDPPISALHRLGPAGARLLIEELDDPSPDVRETLIEVLWRFGADSASVMVAGLQHPNPNVREGVLLALGYAPGPKSVAVRDMLPRLGDADPLVRLAAAEAVVTADTKGAGPAVPALVEAAFSRTPAMRSRALGRLKQLEQVARPAVPAMLRRIRTGDLQTRFAAAQVLAAADRGTSATYVPVYVEVLRSGGEYERRQAAGHLRDAGPLAAKALPALREMFEDEDGMTRVLAAEAVGCIAPDDADDAIDTLVEALDSGDPDVRGRNTHRLAAINALKRVGRPAQSAVPALLDLMRTHGDNRFAVEAAVAAIQIDPANAGIAYDQFRAHLRVTIAEPNERWLATLPELGAAAKPLLGDLISALKSRHDFQKIAAVDTLRALGPAAAEALPALRDFAMAQPDNARAQAAILAIEKKR
jgi:hypothetical protein